MQLFIIPEYKKEGNIITIKDNPELLNQLRKVLRAKEGYKFAIQSISPDYRYSLKLLSWTNTELKAEIQEASKAPETSSKVAMAIALPNKQEKLELIVQKLTEIWISTIILRHAERSIIKELNENKQTRLHKIIKEAAEQSYSWEIPQVILCKDLSEISKEYQPIIFDIPKEGEKNTSLKPQNLSRKILGIIGPEGGLSQKDYQQFWTEYQILSLGTSVLRMETAAIIGGRRLKNKE